CDEIIATPDARFAFPEARAGYVTTAGSVRRLIDAIGSARAKQLLLSASTLDGATAHDAGLVSRLCSDTELLRTALDCAELYRNLPRRSVSAMKGLVRSQLGGSSTRSWIEEVEAFEDLVGEDDP
ncbi:MAG: enoyl-CoA hydratase/isomerase family protein, partial [Myxococcota bacterium]